MLILNLEKVSAGIIKFEMTTRKRVKKPTRN